MYIDIFAPPIIYQLTIIGSNNNDFTFLRVTVFMIFNIFRVKWMAIKKYNRGSILLVIVEKWVNKLKVKLEFEKRNYINYEFGKLMISEQKKLF